MAKTCLCVFSSGHGGLRVSYDKLYVRGEVCR